MATIFPPFRSLAPRTALLWSANNATLGGAVIDGNDANFAGIVGGEQVTIARFGSPATLITMLAGDVSASLVAARINTTFPGLASVNGDGGVRLVDGTSVQVTTISAPDQAKIGLPAAMVRDASAGYVASVRPDRTFDPDRTDFASQPIAIPDGANRIAAWLKVLGNDATEVGSKFTFAFSNGTEGVISTTVIQGALSSQATLASDEGFLLYEPTIEQFYIGSQGPNLGFTFPVELEVPPGATEFQVVVAGAVSPGGTLAYSPATVSGGVIPGVRLCAPRASSHRCSAGRRFTSEARRRSGRFLAATLQTLTSWYARVLGLYVQLQGSIRCWLDFGG